MGGGFAMAEMKPKYESGEKNNEVEFKRKVNLDGSYAEIITDHQNKRGEIREYDAQGNCVNAVYFRLS